MKNSLEWRYTMLVGFRHTALLALALLLGCSRRQGSLAILDETRSLPGNYPIYSICPNWDAALDPTWKDHLPQGALLRGQCLERLTRVEHGATAQPEDYVGYPEKGESLSLKISEAGIEHLINGSDAVKLYTVKAEDGRSFCPTEAYTPTPEEFSRRCPSGGEGCSYFEELKGKAMLVPGYWVGNTWTPSTTSYTVSCISGAIAKCIQWGYRPDAFQGHELQRPLGELFRACVHAARATYKNDDQVYTCQGTRVDMYDAWNIQRKQVAEYTFESLWGKYGLVCMKRARYPGCEGLPIAPDCEDPSPGVGKDWQGSEGLIAVSSSSSNDLHGKCPTVPNACP
jgi:hypothetical protein